MILCLIFMKKKLDYFLFVIKINHTLFLAFEECTVDYYLSMLELIFKNSSWFIIKFKMFGSNIFSSESIAVTKYHKPWIPNLLIENESFQYLKYQLTFWEDNVPFCVQNKFFFNCCWSYKLCAIFKCFSIRNIQV